MAYALRLLADTHISKQIAIQLRAKGVDVIRLEELVDLSNDADDVDILEYATANNRAVLSLDDDFRRLHWQRLTENKIHYGIFLGRSELQGIIGYVVNSILDYAESIDSMDDTKNQLIEFGN